LEGLEARIHSLRSCGQSDSGQMYLIGGFLDQMVLVSFECQQQAQELVHGFEVLSVSDAFGLNHQQRLKRMNDLLDNFPLFRTVLNRPDITFHNFIDFFILLNINEQQVMRGLPDISLNINTITLSSESRLTSLTKL
jgi:hypothetical protein